MVRDRLPAIEKEGNAVTGKHAAQFIVVAVHAPEQDGGFAEPPSRPDKRENFPCRQNRLRRRRVTNSNAQ